MKPGTNNNGNNNNNNHNNKTRVDDMQGERPNMRNESTEGSFWMPKEMACSKKVKDPAWRFLLTPIQHVKTSQSKRCTKRTINPAVWVERRD
mmetsp:Transcript_21735/g.45401  ORF Transcript_21735/g.45401 Transcript_21735/m.45401 type:complete len:92 (+) Transcript_21735:2-277(+)